MKNVAEIEEIEKEIEVLREKLNTELDNIDKSKTTAEEVLELSKEVDKVILKYQKMLNKD